MAIKFEISALFHEKNIRLRHLNVYLCIRTIKLNNLCIYTGENPFSPIMPISIIPSKSDHSFFILIYINNKIMCAIL